jgi:hypothetical protein
MPLLLLQLDSRPFLLLNRVSLPLSWNTGLFLKIRTQASHVVLTSNSITYFRNDAPNDLLRAGWDAFSCAESDDSLCLHSPQLDMFNSKLVQEPYIYSDALQQQYALGRDVCSRNNARQVVNSSMYTVSMCDLIDTRAQFVLVESKDSRFMYVKTDSTSVVEYVLLAFVCLYAVATLAKHGVLLVKVAGVPETQTKDATQISTFIPHAILKYARMSFLHVVLSVYIAVAVLLDMHSIATRGEAWLALYLVVYVLWDCVVSISKISHNLREELKQINVMVVLLMMCCLRLYHTFQNVFHELLVVMFAIRTWCKLLIVLLINANPAEPAQTLFAYNLWVLYDVVTLYLLLLCLNHTTEDDFHSRMVNSSILLIAMQLGGVVAILHKRT